jgi:hypothetical protein
MPVGFHGTKRITTRDEDNEIARFKRAQLNHDEELRQRGFDPQYIGITEVKPVRCCGCGAPIPWAVLKGYAS